MEKRSEIKFIRPCLYENENRRTLTADYTLQCIKKRKIVQINLDNCSLQRMEELSSTSNLEDANKVGLLPLVDLLQSGDVCLTAIGVNEMPDSWVEKSIAAYKNFCNIFWPGHIDDPDATLRKYDPKSEKKKISFWDLSDEARTVYGIHYISMLQIQNIKLNYANTAPEEKFEIYIYSIIQFIDLISAYDMELAKYAFWDLDSNAINRLPERIHKRRQYIKRNFHKNGNDLDKCRWYAFDAAMDVHWLTGANLVEDIGSKITISGVRFDIEHWVGTNDHKLHYISQDIHHVHYRNSTMKRLMVSREEELTKFDYWYNVDRLYNSLLSFRNQAQQSIPLNITERIDIAIKSIESDLSGYFIKKIAQD